MNDKILGKLRKIDFKKILERLANRTIRYLLNILVGVDQLINVILLGDPDETISSRVGRVMPNSKIAKAIDWLMFYQRDHCRKAIERDEGKGDILFPAKSNKITCKSGIYVGK